MELKFENQEEFRDFVQTIQGMAKQPEQPTGAESCKLDPEHCSAAWGYRYYVVMPFRTLEGAQAGLKKSQFEGKIFCKHQDSFYRNKQSLPLS